MGQTCGEQIALLAPDFLYLGFVMPHESRSVVDRSTMIADVQAGRAGGSSFRMHASHSHGVRARTGHVVCFKTRTVLHQIGINPALQH